ncbi:MAG TPA: Bax inhibitor-1 family protein [Candidatus Limnocylindrales bacterium]|nr:Bax inhibitor-1 family protein [Candidatus Limnocylindrales bacterium]
MASWFGSGTYTEAAREQSTLARVLGLLGLAAVFTAVGALFGPALGQIGFWVALVGGLIVIIALRAARDVAPLNLILLIVFATLEGIVLGQVLELYVSAGLSLIVFQAAAATAVAALTAGVVGYTTKRDLSNLGGFLFGALVIVIVASVVGLFIQAPLLWTVISAVSAILFTAFLVYDLNRVARIQGATEGQAILLAVSVYLDIYNLFLDLLTLLSGRRR